jgi:hypothetical protein
MRAFSLALRLPLALPRPRRRGATLLLAGAAALAGCTSQAWYEGARAGADVRCQDGPPAAYDDCMERQNQKSYEDYRRAREDAAKAP